MPGFMRQVVAQNLKALMNEHFREAGDKPMALAKASGLSKSSVQRILAQETGASLDNLEALAAAFHLSAYQLLVPALDVNNPQVVQGATKEEERLYRLWRKNREITHTEQYDAAPETMGRPKGKVA